MNCRRFEKGWNELLDSRPEGSSELGRALQAHASTCQHCRGVSARYQVLRQAVSVLRPPPGPSADSIERLHALTISSAPPAILRQRSRSKLWYCVPLTSAALFVVAWLGGIGRAPENLARRPAPSTGVPVVATRPLGMALAEATQATLDLAREASAPASRIGLEMLDLGKVEVSRPAGGPEIEADWPSPGVLQSVGERVTAGVKPISGSARHAFSFLLGPPPVPTPAPRETQGSL